MRWFASLARLVLPHLKIGQFLRVRPMLSCVFDKSLTAFGSFLVCQSVLFDPIRPGGLFDKDGAPACYALPLFMAR